MINVTLSIKGTVETVEAIDIGHATAAAIRAHNVRTCDVAVLACDDPADPTLDECLMPKGAIRYA